jgi:hypothetical protein
MNQKFWRSVFSEKDGSGSASRVFAFFILAFALGWGTAVLVLTHKIDAENVKELIQAAAWFYGINKAGEKLPEIFARNQQVPEKAN